MKLRDAIKEINDHPDAWKLARLMNALQFEHGMNYNQQAEFFRRCDPRIDLARFEELCQIADGM
jgi:hypothetical protein